MAEVILRAEGLSKAYGRPSRLGRARRERTMHRPALANVSLALERGEVLGVVGESGSGKTTLARCLTMLTRPDSGRVVFEGSELSQLRGRALRERRRGIQVVFQDPHASLNPRLSIGSALSEVLRVHSLVPRQQIAARVEELLGLVGLSTRVVHRFPSDFSGGQRQRLCIARALATEPSVIVADEPVSSLDVSIQAQVLNLMLSLRDSFGLSIVFISHDLHVVRRVAPKVVVMFAGRIVEVLSADRPLEAAEHPYTRALVAAAPRLDTMMRPIADAGKAERQVSDRGCPYYSRCGYSSDICAVEDPPLIDHPEGGAVACHYVNRREQHDK